MKNMKTKILTTITGFSIFGLFISAMALDSESLVPFIAGGVCLLWLLLFIYANRDQLGPLEDYEDYEEYED